MPRLPLVSGREAVSVFERAGFEVRPQRYLGLDERDPRALAYPRAGRWARMRSLTRRSSAREARR